MRAAIGPCIAQPSYEVGPEMLAQFVAEDPASEALFAPVAGSDRLLFDLKGYVLRRLAAAGIQIARRCPTTRWPTRRAFSARAARGARAASASACCCRRSR